MAAAPAGSGTWACAATSERVIRPRGPVPRSAARSTPWARASLRASGVARTAAGPAPSPSVLGADAVTGSAAAGSGRDSGSRARLGRAAGLAAPGSGGRPGSAAAGSGGWSTSARSPTLAITAPTGSVSPTAATIVSTPSAGDS